MSLVDLFLRLDRAGPGNAESLRWALGVARTPADARVLDAGCGTGADTGTLLAAVPGGTVTALDAAADFVASVATRYPAVTALQGDMAEPPAGPWDLIWSAGAVYNLGVGRALEAWRGVLAPGGRVAFSDLRWTTPTPPKEAAAFWQAGGVTLTDAAGLEVEVRAAGWRVLGARWVGRAGWARYYDPLDVALAEEPDSELTRALKAEIALWKRWGDSYDYRLLVVEPA
ncbi:class I SAM-dependent methyltransferase [Pararhodobacter aggregans]|uniref:class I SAM-dependent methyltransferase n=1 Tax=Pararhodobacter aggregans TaxID=404875 RepID=UPI003A9538EA